MDWASKFSKGFSTKMPSLDELKSKMNNNLEQMNQQVQNLQSKVGGSEEILNKISNVFDLDQLQKTTSGGVNPNAGGGDRHMPELDLTYITDRLVVMGFPGKKLGAVSSFLNEKHGSEYMIWNLSEKPYDYSVYNGQVIDFKFPGYPSPPLDMLFKLCMSMESWLSSDPKNIVVIHCMTGRGRSATVGACLLEWVGKARTSKDAVHYICQKRQAKRIDQAIVPTQMRYVNMFHDIMDGIRPRYDPLNLKRLKVYFVPDMLSQADRKRSDVPRDGGCRPYAQIFKNGKLLYSTMWADSQAEEGTISYPSGPNETFEMELDCFVDGDILLRMRHVDTDSGKGISMFRYGFHTGYVPCGVLKLDKKELDGASVDPRFHNQFRVELEFEPATRTDDPDHKMDDMFDATVTNKTEFWDQINKKKTLAKNRTKSEQQQLIDNPSSFDTNTNVTETTAGSGDAKTMSTTISSVSEDDITEFRILDDEEEDDDDDAGPKTRNPSDFSDDMLLFQELAAKDKEPEHEHRMEQQQQQPPSPPPKQPDTSIGDFDELEALEKDLGSILSTDTKTETKGTVEQHQQEQPPSQTPPDADPDLEELEKYLSEL